MNDNPVGVTLHKPEKCDDGYRLYSSRNSEQARLIDLDGSEVHRWEYPQGHSWHYAEMQPGGSLIAIIKDVMILELDWNSNLLWKAELRAHHDFARLANGNTIVATRREMCNPFTGEGKLHCDVLVELTPRNEAVWQWEVERRAQELGRMVPLLMPPSTDFGDWPHVNTVEVLPDNPTAEKDRRFRAGNLLICGRHIDAIWIIDRDTDEIVWAWGPGELAGPHMPTMLPSGNILLYDNGNNTASEVRGYTRVIEIEPIGGRIVWQYRADPPESFNSPARGSNERLPNGNTFIAESDPGRCFEVAPDGEMVWEFRNPDFNDAGRRAALYRVCRHDRAQVDRLIAQHAKG